MNKTLSTLVLSASFAVGAGAIAQAPASAYTINGSDYLLYDVNGTQTYVNPNANINKLLEGNSASPGGNIELFASSEQKSLATFKASDARTSIVGTYAGKNLTLSSLTAKDWFGDSLNTNYGQTNFANKWFNAFYDAAGLASSFGNTALKRGLAYNAFLNANLFQASSDPNISYITTDNGSDLLIGLAGHYDLKAYYQTKLGPLGNLIKNGFQASEVVKVQYGDVSDLLYSFSATNSGLTEKTDRSSHSGNYQVSLKGVVPPKSVPEPSLMLGLAAVGGMVAASKRKSAQK